MKAEPNGKANTQRTRTLHEMGLEIQYIQRIQLSTTMQPKVQVLLLALELKSGGAANQPGSFEISKTQPNMNPEPVVSAIGGQTIRASKNEHLVRYGSISFGVAWVRELRTNFLILTTID